MSRKTNNKGNEYFRVMTDTSEPGAADVYLYGYIGQEKWWDDDPTEALTDLAVVKAIKDLEKSYSRINIRINSPGGSVMHGDPIISAIRNSTADIHTYNDGMAASMAFDIWVAGKNRHARRTANSWYTQRRRWPSARLPICEAQRLCWTSSTKRVWHLWRWLPEWMKKPSGANITTMPITG